MMFSPASEMRTAPPPRAIAVRQSSWQRTLWTDRAV